MQPTAMTRFNWTTAPTLFLQKMVMIRYTRMEAMTLSLAVKVTINFMVAKAMTFTTLIEVMVRISSLMRRGQTRLNLVWEFLRMISSYVYKGKISFWLSKRRVRVLKN